MVKELQKNDNTYYVCESCNCAYSDRELAAKCQEWCMEYHRCNIKIMKQRVDMDAAERER